MAAVVLAVTRGSVRPVAPLPAYAAVSLSNVIATTCQYEALRYVSFPVQTLGKCGKMIPVMLWGRLMTGRRYTTVDYLVAASITAGATVFLLGGDVSSPAAKHGHRRSSGEVAGSGGWLASLYGGALMVGYLGCDGFTSTLQDRLFKGYAMETFNQMLWVTASSAALSAVWLVTDSTMGDALAFVHRHPECLRAIWALSLSSSIGQLFILTTIKEFGALVFATVMTSRQFMSILLSCLLFMHPLTGVQWLGTATIFGALYYQAATKSGSSHGGGSSGAKKLEGHGGEGGAGGAAGEDGRDERLLPLTMRDVTAAPAAAAPHTGEGGGGGGGEESVSVLVGGARGQQPGEATWTGAVSTVSSRRSVSN